MRIEIPYDSEQMDALTDSQIYNLPYGLEYGSYQKIVVEAKKLGYTKVGNISMDDVNFKFIVEVS